MLKTILKLELIVTQIIAKSLSQILNNHRSISLRTDLNMATTMVAQITFTDVKQVLSNRNNNMFLSVEPNQIASLTNHKSRVASKIKTSQQTILKKWCHQLMATIRTIRKGTISTRKLIILNKEWTAELQSRTVLIKINAIPFNLLKSKACTVNTQIKISLKPLRNMER